MHSFRFPFPNCTRHAAIPIVPKIISLVGFGTSGIPPRDVVSVSIIRAFLLLVLQGQVQK